MTDWSALEVGGAFILGATIGGLAVVRITSYLLDYLRRRDGRDPPPGGATKNDG